ncbi:MAG: DNA polymerase III subunit gamma/tau [Parasporobacterium sp.]|nr:DNA polymerase III subunit gamma/tau [Parasporobacterium sp.]
MAYVALYRKFRPKTFEQVKGQDHIIRTLKNQIKNNRIGHAYLFTGTRGTGKTSVAKILAKAVNCLNPKDGEPCCECENCLAANQGSFMDIVEIDAASNTGVEDIRRVIEEIQYTPAKGKYKVYIIDEVHMLSMNAFNAFLKTLEEPPEYVVFVLATTEPHKLPATILSRCQRYDFKRIETDVIAANLLALLNEEGIEAEDAAVRYVARAGDGSMRDSLSLLDRCVAFSLGEKITYENVLSVLGTVDTEDFSALYRAVYTGDVTASLKIIEKTIDSGRDLTPFVSDFIMYLRNLLILNVGGKSGTELLGLSEENLKLLMEDSKSANGEILMRYIRILSELLNQLRFSSEKQILTEVAIIKLARPQMETGMDSVLDRIRQLEQRALTQAPAAQQSFAQQAAPAAQQSSVQEPAETAAPANMEPQGFEQPEPFIIDMAEDEFSYVPEYYDEMAMQEEPAETPHAAAPAAGRTGAASGSAALVRERWLEVLSACDDRRLKTFLNKVSVEADEAAALTIYTTGEIAYKQLKEKTVLEYLRQLIADVCGANVEIYVKHMERKPEIPDQQDLSSLFKNINMNIETEEF